MTHLALGGAATAEGMRTDSPHSFWEMDNPLNSRPSGRALQAALEKALAEGHRCTRPLRLQCSGHGDHEAHWRYAPCDTRYEDQCEPCARRYAAQTRAVIQGGLTTHAADDALAFTLTAPGASEFGEAPQSGRTATRPFKYEHAVAWNACLRQAVHDFLQRVKRAAKERGADATAIAYWVVIEFQQRGLGHVHGVICGATAEDILTAAHGGRVLTGGRTVQVSIGRTGRKNGKPQQRVDRRAGHMVARSVRHIAPRAIAGVRSQANAMTVELASAGKPFGGKHWARVAEPDDDTLLSADEFIDLLDLRARKALGRGDETTTHLDWRWGEQVHVERFPAKSGAARGNLARYLAKYVTKSIGVAPGTEGTASAHQRQLMEAASLLPCAAHGFYLCGCTREAAAIASFGLTGNPYSQSSNWGLSLTELRQARSAGKIRHCTWQVVGSGYPALVSEGLREQEQYRARARGRLDLRAVLRSLVVPIAGPAAP